ncbi:hypothetical protein OC834_006501, partial [Tilletia horrida]
APTVAVSEHELRSSLSAYHDDIKYSDVSHSTDSAIPTSTPSQMRLRESADASSRDREDDVQRYGIISLEALPSDRLKTSGFFDSEAIENLKSDGHYSDYNVALTLTGATVYGLANERLHGTRLSEELA